MNQTRLVESPRCRKAGCSKELILLVKRGDPPLQVYTFGCPRCRTAFDITEAELKKEGCLG